MKMNEQELNKKLAEWAGFKNPRFEEEGIIFTGAINGRVWGNLYVDLFTQSLDACFKWLVPKAELDEIRVWKTGAGWGADIMPRTLTTPIVNNYGETPALALCLAINKMIENE